MVIKNNIGFMTAHRHYQANNALMMKASLRLSSGKKINSAADDPAGLAISQKMKAQIRGLEVARKNAIDAQGLLRVADGAMQTVHDILQRLNELTVQAASGTKSDFDRGLLDIEFQELLKELDETTHGATYNGMRVFGSTFSQKISAQDYANIQESGVNGKIGSFSQIIGPEVTVKDAELTSKNIDFDSILSLDDEGVSADNVPVKTGSFDGFTIQTGPNEGDDLLIALHNVDTRTLGMGGLSIATQEGAQAAIEIVGNAIKSVSAARAQIGAAINRLDYRISNIEIYTENLMEAESRISDADLAKEMMNFTKHKILADVGMAMMLHEQVRQETVLQLFQF